MKNFLLSIAVLVTLYSGQIDTYPTADYVVKSKNQVLVMKFASFFLGIDEIIATYQYDEVQKWETL